MLGTDPLDKGFTGERSFLKIGNGNKIRDTTRFRAAPTGIGHGDRQQHFHHDLGTHRAQFKIANDTVIASSRWWRDMSRWTTKPSSAAAW